MKKHINYKRIQLGDIAKVYTYNSYNILMQKQRNFEQRNKLFIDKTITPQLSCCYNVKILNKKPSYVLISNLIDILYISFFLNSIIGKLCLIDKNTKGLKGYTNISRIKSTNIIIYEKAIPACSFLEYLLNYLELINIKQKCDKLETVEYFFSKIRDYIVMEFIAPDIFELENISIIDLWIKEYNKLDQMSDIKKTINSLLESLMKPGNILMANINKMRIIKDDTLITFNKEYNGVAYKQN